ncbi:uncharacterized protein isoform X2 [Musca autumnalis]
MDTTNGKSLKDKNIKDKKPVTLFNKVERFNEKECKASPVASRTRQGCRNKYAQEAVEQMPPPPPPPVIKEPELTFEMLHEDDSTDDESFDENTVFKKRPPPPSWSFAHNRKSFVLKQEFTPSDYVDCFFSVQPMTPDLREMFPNIHARHLKRRSSAFWSTPPRYSELPRY